MAVEFLAPSPLGRKATLMLWCQSPVCKQAHKKRFKLTLDPTELESVPYAPREEADMFQVLNNLIGKK